MLLLEDKIQKIAKLVDLKIGDKFYEGVFPFKSPEYHFFKKRGVKFDLGASKFVAILKDSAYVLKIPFTGHLNEFYEEETGHFGWEYDDFSGCNDNERTGDTWNYCKVEAINYNIAVCEGFGKYFAETKFYGKTKGGFPMYIQEKCRYTYVSRPLEDSIKKAERLCESNWSVEITDPNWVASFIEFYGEDEFFRLNEFIQSLDGINDLTCKNVGYTMSGLPVLIDFSGFNC